MKFHGTNSMTLSEDAIKVGHEVPGARLIVNQRLNQGVVRARLACRGIDAYNGEAARNAHAAAASTWRNTDGSLAFKCWQDYKPTMES